MKNLTKSHILSCFNNLMKEYPCEKITVEMIIKNSEVSNSTFYRHYIDKFDVMNYSYVNFVEKMFEFNLCKNLKDVLVTFVLPSTNCHPMDSVTQVGSQPKISS